MKNFNERHDKNESEVELLYLLIIIIVLLMLSCSTVEYIDSTPDIEVFPQKQVTYALTADGWAVDTIPR